jgi:hypothetical protein
MSERSALGEPMAMLVGEPRGILGVDVSIGPPVATGGTLLDAVELHHIRRLF